MPSVTLRIADEFIENLAQIYSTTLLERIRAVVERLRMFPDMGSPTARPALKRQYGDDIRTLAISSFVLVYRHVGEFVDVLALVYGPKIG